jgi:thiol-disulfide isomerase/thioredoxin
MRALGVKQVLSEKSKESSVAKNSQRLSNMYQASSKEECQTIAQDNMDRLTVFRFFAPWCRACKKIAPRFDKMARDHPDINFVQVPYNDDSKDFIATLGIPSLPYGAVFDPTAGLIEQVNINPNKFDAFEKIVNSYDAGECELTEDMINENGIYSAPYLRHV